MKDKQSKTNNNSFLNHIKNKDNPELTDNTISLDEVRSAMSKMKDSSNKSIEKNKRKEEFDGSDEKDDFEESQEIDDSDNPKKSNKLSAKASKGMLLGFLFVALLLVAIGFVISLTTEYNSYEVIEETGVKNAAMVDYVPYKESLLKYSKDGATYVNGKDQAVWNETYAMKMPVADVSGDYIAIADLNGNDVYVFDAEGKVSNTTMPYRICDIAVASQGEFAVILESEKENYINIYDKNGDPISEIQTTLDKSGYPMDIDLSENGEKLFSTYLYLDGVQAKNGLAAYNFGPVGQNENADRLVGGYQLEGTVVPKVEFLDNNTVCAFGDNQFIIYSMREKSSEKAKITFDQEIRSVVYGAGYIGVVLPNDSEKEEDAKIPYVFELYNTNGKKVLRKNIDFRYEKVRMIGDEIVFTGAMECRIFTIKGKNKFSYTFNKNIIDMVPTGYGRRYIAIYDTGSEVVRLKHEGKQEEE